MKRTSKLLTMVLTTLVLYACGEDNVKLDYEPGMYKAYKQELSPVYTFADNEEVDGSLISVSTPFVSNPNDPLRDPMTTINTIYLEKNNTGWVYCPTCLNEPMHVSIKGDSLFMTPKILKDAVKFAPYSETGFALIEGEEAKRHTTLQGKITDEGFILSTYNVYIKSSNRIKGTTDAYYLDIDYLKEELRTNDTLIYVKKNTYFRK